MKATDQHPQQNGKWSGRAGRRSFITAQWVVLFTAVFLLAALLILRAFDLRTTAQLLVPAAGAVDVSTTTHVSVRFDQPIETEPAPTITLQPPASGSLRWQGSTLTLAPSTPLQANTTYTVIVPAGVPGPSGRTLQVPLTWQFRTASPRILFLSWHEEEQQQLFVTNLQGTSASQLTESEHGVAGYTVSPQGQTIVYTAQRADGGTDLWALGRDGEDRGQVLDCAPEQCRNPVWAPDGRRLLYERWPVPLGAEPPRLWWLDTETGDTLRVFEDDEERGLGAAFSADGRWLAYVSPLAEEIRIVDLDTADRVIVPSSTSETPAWAPHENTLLTNDVQMQGERFSIYIYRVNVAEAIMHNLSGDTETDDGAPSWSPDGSWIAFGRKVPRAPVGRQLWLMRPDGSERTPLTNDQESNFSRPLWSPDGTTLLFQRFRIPEPQAEPGIWLLDMDSGELQQVVTPGFHPQWLP